MYNVIVPKNVEKAMAKLASPIRNKMLNVLRELKVDPRPRQAIKMQGYECHYRLRFGDYRLVYRIDDAQLVVVALKAAHRREVYR